MTVFTFNALTPLNWINWILLVAAFVVEAWAFVDALRRPTAAFPAAGKRTKPLWLVITGVSLALAIACRKLVREKKLDSPPMQKLVAARGTGNPPTGI